MLPAKPNTAQKNAIVPSNTDGDLLLAKPSIVVGHEAFLSSSDLNEIRQHLRDIHQQMSSSREDVLATRQDLKQLQGLLASQGKGGELSNTLQVLVDDMHSLADEARLSKLEFRDSLSTLKLLAENERKALQGQISNERVLAATQRDSYEERIGKLMDDKAMFDIDKEKLDRKLKKRCVQFDIWTCPIGYQHTQKRISPNVQLPNSEQKIST
jgi:chromosome segregation ATPase